MKRFGHFLMTALAACVMVPLLQSCDDNEYSGPTSVALVTVVVEENPLSGENTYYFRLDDERTLYPTLLEGGAQQLDPQNGQRAYIYFDILPEKYLDYDFNIRLYACDLIETKDVVELTEENQEEFGNEIIQVRGSLLTNDYLMLEYTILYSDPKKHEIDLVYDPAYQGENNEYVYLSLRHTSEETTTLYSGRGLIAFRLNDYNPVALGKKGIILRVHTANDSYEEKPIDISSNQ